MKNRNCQGLHFVSTCRSCAHSDPYKGAFAEEDDVICKKGAPIPTGGSDTICMEYTPKALESLDANREAFKTELACLLARYNASICIKSDDCSDWLGVTGVGIEACLFPKNTPPGRGWNPSLIIPLCSGHEADADDILE